MDILYHFPLCAASRKCRIALLERDAGEIELREVRVWERAPEFLALNPAGEIPVLVTKAGTIIGHYAICEWLVERDRENIFMPESVIERAEVRRLVAWFDDKFEREVGALVTHEKLIRRLKPPEAGGGAPNMELVRVGLHNLAIHLSYLQYLLERRDWLAGERFTLADIAAAAHLSCLDYSGDINWKTYAAVHEWYARVKSRPSMRPLLADHIAGFRPPTHYADLDF